MSEIYLNKSYKSYDKLSRYESFPYYYDTENNKYVYGITAYLNANTAYFNHLTGPSDTLDALALYYYGNPTYYWIIADFNRILDAYEKLQPGMWIRIPSISSIEFNVD